MVRYQPAYPVTGLAHEGILAGVVDFARLQPLAVTRQHGQKLRHRHAGAVLLEVRRRHPSTKPG
jgi:hypothetical protein